MSSPVRVNRLVVSIVAVDLFTVVYEGSELRRANIR